MLRWVLTATGKTNLANLMWAGFTSRMTASSGILPTGPFSTGSKCCATAVAILVFPVPEMPVRMANRLVCRARM